MGNWEHLFSLKEKIKGKKEIEKVYLRGESLFSESKKIRAICLIEEKKDYLVKIAVAVSKRSGKAVWRNKAKRLLRESYRLNKQLLFIPAAKEKKSVKIIFSLINLTEKNKKKINLNDILPHILEVMNLIKAKIQR